VEDKRCHAAAAAVAARSVMTPSALADSQRETNVVVMSLMSDEMK
jgi:hypothetical protein